MGAKGLTPQVMFQLCPSDTPFLGQFKKQIAGRLTGKVSTSDILTASDPIVKLKGFAPDSRMIATTSEALLQKILGNPKKEASINDYAGSIIEYKDYDYLILDPLSNLFSVPYGKHLFNRFTDKFAQPDKFISLPEFSWEIFQSSRYKELLNDFANADFISNDIETIPTEDRHITCIGFTAVYIRNRKYSLRTVVVPFDSEIAISFCGEMLALANPKIYQNGKYDIAYELRYGIPPTNYAFDTINMFHAWYSELPKDLAFIASFMLRKWQYWKELEGVRIGSEEYYRYNARDCFSTAAIGIALLIEMPEFAMRNFIREFSVTYPCILSEAQGIRIDGAVKDKLVGDLTVDIADRRQELQTMVGSKSFNPGSWQQLARLFGVLGSGHIKGTGKIARDKCKHAHPLNMVLMDRIDIYKEKAKLKSTIAPEKGDGEFTWHDRCFYALNPFGTDTGRLASKKHHYWCGLNIQNQDENTKEMFIAEPGFHFGECDYKQNETWITAYTSGDPELLNAVHDKSKDFHGRNANKFFGVPYESVVETSFDGIEYIHKVIDKVLRDLAKRPNHGANYNMTAGVMLDTMGIANVLRAQKLLKLSPAWSLKRVCQHLLDVFDATYKIVRGLNYEDIRGEVASTGMMVGPTGWTRVCFSNPAPSSAGGTKRAMNMYAAHRGQSPAAMILNKAYDNTYQRIALREPDDFRLGPQIHDSIMFQYRIGREDLVWRVADCMDIKTSVRDIFGVTRVLNVPTDCKGGSPVWARVKDMRRARI